MNPIPLIRSFYETLVKSGLVTMDRVHMITWVKERAPEEWKQFPDFAADVLIASGFGHDEEQEDTVYCRAIGVTRIRGS